MNPNFQHIRAYDGSLWLCEPTHLDLAIARARSRPCPTIRDLAEFRRVRLEEAAAAAGKALRAVKGKVGVIPIIGPIEQRMSTELYKAGGTSTEEVGIYLDSMLADKTIDAIVFAVDSPGGSVFGVQELADKIFAARGQKKTYAIADSMACSAAYWIATAAEQMVCTPGGMVGSVGVYTMHVDLSQALDKEGVRVSYIHAAKYKVEGNPYSPLADDARANWQERVDEIYGRFTAALKRNRDVPESKVRKDFGEGRVVTAETALDRNMIDRIMTFDELLGKLTGRTASGGSQAAADIEVLRLRQEQRKRSTHL